MPLPDSIALRLGRADTAMPSVMATGTTVSNNSAPGVGVAASASFNLGTGRDSLVLLVMLVGAVIALSYWTR